MATIRRRNGTKTTSFQVRYYYSGEEMSKTFRSLNNTKTAIRDAERAANQFAKDIEASIQLGIKQYTNNVTFEEYAKEFLVYHSMGKKETTIDNYNSIFPMLYQVFGRFRMAEITAMHLDRYFMKLQNDGLAMNTIRKRRDMLSLVLRSARKKGVIKENPLEAIDFVFNDARGTKRDRGDKLIKPDEFRTIYESFQVDHHRTFMVLCLLAGLRAGEACALTWDDVYFEQDYIDVNKSVNKYLNISDPKTFNSYRKIYLVSTLKEVLLRRCEVVQRFKEMFGKSYNDNNLVICKEDGAYINPERLSKTFNVKNKTYGTHLTPHMLRHTFATLVNRANTNVKDLQQLMGHSSADISLNTYTHFTPYSNDTKDKMELAFTDFLKE